MKKNALAVLGLTALFAGVGFAVVPFNGWDALVAKSPQIIVAKCLKAPVETLYRGNGVAEVTRDGIVPSEIEVIVRLKGITNRGPVRAYCKVPLRRGEDYLIFAHYFNAYYAAEEYCVVPLGSDFSTDILAGKQLDAQIQILLQFRLNHLNREMENLQQEKMRLEAGLKR